ncbi:MAG: hypothetical protein ABSG84_10965 [Acidobacteriaceae bacterium]|jgi:hypothetical protein
MKRRWINAAVILVAAGVIALAGCATNSSANLNPAPLATGPHGEVFGGALPVSGMTLQLYAVSTSGYGTAATPLFSPAITTNSSGGFTFPSNYCPAPSTTPVYLVGTSGDPIAGNAAAGNSNFNPNLALMVALGGCNTLNSSTHIHMNELTTVAAVWALAPFMSGGTTSYLNVSTSTTNTTGLQLAFAASSEVVNTSTGTFPGNLPSGATLPTTELNTLADILEACINSKGVGNGSYCTNLFNLTPNTAGTVFPTDTITAAMNIAQNPARYVSQLLALDSGITAFMPNLGTAPNAWTVAIQYTGGGLNHPTTIAADQLGDIWVGNSGSPAVSLFDNLGNAKLAAGTTLGGTPGGVAIDLTGNAWVTASNGDVYKLNSNGATTGTTLTGLNLPTGIAIDPSGVIWVANSGANSVSAFTSTGGTVTGSPFTGAGIASPAGIAINGSPNADCANCK